jgi:hypothetical protein
LPSARASRRVRVRVAIGAEHLQHVRIARDLGHLAAGVRLHLAEARAAPAGRIITTLPP